MVDLAKLIEGIPKTQKIYLDNMYLRNLSVRVLRVYTTRGKRIYVITDKTIFHPKGGGQPSDKGWIRGTGFEVEVKKVLERNGVVIHYGKLKNGITEIMDENVELQLDWNHRYRIMRIHTAGHILDQAVHEVYGRTVETIDALHGPPEPYTEYRAFPPSSSMLRLIEERANRIVAEDRRVKVVYARPGELDAYVLNAPNMKRLPRAELYRIVVIEGINAIPCTGTHVSNTREVGSITVCKAEETEQGFRLYYDVV